VRIGDIEYTRTINNGDYGTVSEITPVSFALGIKVRPLLVRTQVTRQPNTTATSSGGCWLENGSSVPAGLTATLCLEEPRLFPLDFMRQTLTTSGVGLGQWPTELTWWKILLPDVSIHFVGNAAAEEGQCTLHYRFVELTDDEIIEIAAQRAQS